MSFQVALLRIGVPLLLLALAPVACGDSAGGDESPAGAGMAGSSGATGGGDAVAGADATGGADTAAGGADAAAGGADAAAGSGGSGATAGEAASNALLRVSTTHIEFDSRNDESEVVFEVEALRPGVRLYAAKDNGDEPVVDEVNVVDAGTALASVHVRRGTPSRLYPGVLEARVRVTGCVGDDDCSDIFVDVTYTVVHLELEGYPSGMVQDSGLRPAPIHLRRRVDESDPPRLLVPMRRTDESDFAWTAAVDYGVGYTGPEWLSVNGSGSGSDPLELTTDLLYDVPTQRSAQVRVDTDDAVNLSVTVIYETLLPIEVSTHELTFRAKVGEQPEPQTVRIFDAAGDSYPWTLANETFTGGCAVREEFEIELVEGSWDELPAEFSVALPPSPEPTSDTNRCHGRIEVRHISTTTIVHHYIDVTYEVTE